MPVPLDDLIPEFRARAATLIANCGQRGVEMVPYFTVRSPFVQARLWRQSRARAEVDRQVAAFRAERADFLAHCLESVGPQHGDPVTNALPGFSWHQWGEAVDCFWQVSGRAEWSTQKKINGVNGYHVYADEASALGLDAGGRWRSFKDWPHVQFRGPAHPGKVMTLAQIDAEMKARFGLPAQASGAG